MDLDEKSYTLVNENVRCLGTTPIFKGFKSNDECRESCDAKDSCKFYAIWISQSGQRTWCETYSECPSEAHDGHYTIRLWKKGVLQSTGLDEKSYTQGNENARCSGTTPIFKGFKFNDECRELCDAKDSCKFYALWSTSSWCETYSECPSESPAGSNENFPRLWKKGVLG